MVSSGGMGLDSTSGPLLKNSRFLRLWIGQGTSFLGDAVSMVALVILVVQITGSASAVGGALVARLLPTLASPLAGVLADRLDRRLVLVASDLARAALVLGLVFARDLATIYVLVFLMGLARTLFNPTIRAAFPSVVGGGDLTRANALIGGTFSVSETAGPALGGLLVATVGVDAAFVLDSATYLISAASLSLISLPRPQREEEGAGFGEDLRSGFAYLAGARVPLAIVLGAFLTVLTINTTIPAEVFLAKETFDAGNAGYGILVGLYGGGMVLGSALMAALGDHVRLLPFYFFGVFVTALALVGAGLSPSFVVALGALMVAGVANGTENVTTDTILQKRVPDAFLGRVFSVRFLSFSIGEFFAYGAGGAILDTSGARFTYLLAGAATTAAGLVIIVFLAVTSDTQPPDAPPQESEAIREH
ncbi:MFS transporter [soil metagenome]